MRVVLVNTNTAVSRLITLSLNKIGASYVEYEDLGLLEGQSFDALILDSDVGADVALAREFAPVVICLIPRGSEPLEGADASLEKPFLPTEFISVFESATSGVVAMQDTKESAEFADFDSVGGLDDTLEDLPLLDDLGLDESLSLDDMLKTSDDESLDELEPLEIDEAGETELDDDLSSDVLEQVSEQALGDELETTIDESLELDEVLGLDEVLSDELEELGDSDIVADEVTDEPKDELDDEDMAAEMDLGDLRNLVDEIENMDELSSQDENIDEIEMSEMQEQQEQKDIDINEVLEQDLEQDFKQDLEQDIEQILEQNLEQDLEQEIEQNVKQETPNQALGSDLDSISQDDMLSALGLVNDEGLEVAKDETPTASQDESDLVDLTKLEEDLSHQITQQLHQSLCHSSIKEALKGMNIKISVSFEEA